MSISGSICIAFSDTFLQEIPLTTPWGGAGQGLSSPFVRWRNWDPWEFCDFTRAVQSVSGWTRRELQNVPCQLHLVPVPRHLCTTRCSSCPSLLIKATYVWPSKRDRERDLSNVPGPSQGQVSVALLVTLALWESTAKLRKWIFTSFADHFGRSNNYGLLMGTRTSYSVKDDGLPQC